MWALPFGIIFFQNCHFGKGWDSALYNWHPLVDNLGMDRNEEGNNSAIYRISSPTNADGAKRSPEKPNASALRKNSSGKLQNPNSSKHMINLCYVNTCYVHSISSSFGFWYFGHFSCVIFFQVFFRLAHLALQNVN